MLTLPAPLLGRLAGSAKSTADPRARFHAWLVTRFGGAATSDPVEARKPHLLSLFLLDGLPLPMESCRDITIPGPGGPLRARHYVPRDCPEPAPALIFFHFGGCVLGDLETSHTACTLLAHHARCQVISVAYRLAPEHKFPAAVEDALAAWHWLRGAARTMAIDPDRIALGGDSAGGYLAAAAALSLRDAAEALPRAQLLIYPVLEMDRDALPHTPFDACYPLTRADMSWFAAQYMNGPEDAANPLCSIARAPELSGLPPTLLIQARHDILFDEGDRFAHRLRAEQVPLVRRVHPTLPHAFSAMTGGLPAARKALIDTAHLLGHALRAPGDTLSPIFKETPDE